MNLEEARNITVILSLLAVGGGLLVFLFHAGKFFGRAGDSLSSVTERLLVSLEGQRFSQELLVKISERQATALEASSRNVETMERMAEEKRELAIAMRTMSRRLNEALDNQPSEELAKKLEELTKRMNRATGLPEGEKR